MTEVTLLHNATPKNAFLPLTYYLYSIPNRHTLSLLRSFQPKVLWYSWHGRSTECVMMQVLKQVYCQHDGDVKMIRPATAVLWGTGVCVVDRKGGVTFHFVFCAKPPPLIPSVTLGVFIFILLTILWFYTASETYVRIRIVKTPAINLLTSIENVSQYYRC